MSASTQAKPRAAKVGVRKWYACFMGSHLYSVEKDPEDAAYHLCDTPAILRRNGDRVEDCHVVTGYSGSAKTLKRLVEIAGMDEDSFSAWMTKVYAESSRDGKGTIKAMGEALGLSSARGGRK